MSDFPHCAQPPAEVCCQCNSMQGEFMKTAIRQKVRKTFLFASLLLFPVSMYYFSPYLPFMAAGEGIIAGSLLVFSGMFVTAMLFGRFSMK